MASTISSLIRSASDGRLMLLKIRKLFGESFDDFDVDRTEPNRQYVRPRSKSYHCSGIGRAKKSSLPKRVRFRDHPISSDSHKQDRSFSAPPSSLISGRSRYRSCLTNRVASELILSHEYERHCQMDAILARLQKGLYVLRYKWPKAPKRRYIRISEDNGELIWGRSPSRNLGAINLAEVHAIVLGPRTQAFTDYDWNTGKPWLCFSIVIEGQTLDFQCSDNDEIRSVVVGLQACTTLSFEALTYGRILWTRAILKCIRIALQSGLCTLDVFRNFEVQAKASIRQRKIKELIVKFLHGSNRVKTAIPEIHEAEELRIGKTPRI